MGPTVTTGGEIVRAIAPASGRGLAITQKPNERAIAHYDDQEAIVPDSEEFFIDFVDVVLDDDVTVEALVISSPGVAAITSFEIDGFTEHYAFGIPFENTLGAPNQFTDIVGHAKFSYDSGTVDFWKAHGYTGIAGALPSNGLATGYVDLENGKVGMTILGQNKIAEATQSPYARMRARMEYQVATTGVLYLDTFEQFADEIGLTADSYGRQIYTILQSSDLSDNLKSWGHLHGSYESNLAATGIVSGNGFDASWLATIPGN